MKNMYVIVGCILWQGLLISNGSKETIDESLMAAYILKKNQQQHKYPSSLDNDTLKSLIVGFKLKLDSFNEQLDQIKDSQGTIKLLNVSKVPSYLRAPLIEKLNELKALSGDLTKEFKNLLLRQLDMIIDQCIAMVSYEESEDCKAQDALNVMKKIAEKNDDLADEINELAIVISQILSKISVHCRVQ